MTATMAKMKAFTTGVLDVAWANLHECDTKFGYPGYHSITLAYEGVLKETMENILQESGATKINGVYDEKTGENKTPTGRKMIKFKSTIHSKEGTTVFPCHDSNAKPCKEVVFGGDKARIRLKPSIVSRDGSLSFYLNGVQIVEKNGGDAESGGFDTVDGGYEGADKEMGQEPPEESTDDKAPFEE